VKPWAQSLSERKELMLC